MFHFWVEKGIPSFKQYKSKFDVPKYREDPINILLLVESESKPPAREDLDRGQFFEE